MKDSVKTDTLQRLHTLHNLAEIMRMAPAGSIPPTLRDGQLEEEAEQLRKHYLGRALAQTESARATLAPLTGKVSGFKKELEDNREQLDEMWWTAMLQWTGDTKISDKLIDEVKDKLAEEARNIKTPSQCSGFVDISVWMLR